MVNERIREVIVSEYLDTIVACYNVLGRFNYTSRREKLRKNFIERYGDCMEIQVTFEVVKKQLDESNERIWEISGEMASDLRRKIIQAVDELSIFTSRQNQPA